MAKLTKIEIFISFNVLFHKKAKKYRALFLSHARLLKIFFQFLDLPTSSFVDFPDRKSWRNGFRGRRPKAPGNIGSMGKVREPVAWPDQQGVSGEVRRTAGDQMDWGGCLRERVPTKPVWLSQPKQALPPSGERGPSRSFFDRATVGEDGGRADGPVASAGLSRRYNNPRFPVAAVIFPT